MALDHRQAETVPVVLDTQPIRQVLRRFLAGFLARRCTDADNIFERGCVNSLFAMQLVLFIEHTFELTVESDDLRIEHFASVDAMTAFIVDKQSRSRP